jgi:hypothetical protein
MVVSLPDKVVDALHFRDVNAQRSGKTLGLSEEKVDDVLRHS